MFVKHLGQKKDAKNMKDNIERELENAKIPIISVDVKENEIER